jgi:hypothetical protein
MEPAQALDFVVSSKQLLLLSGTLLGSLLLGMYRLGVLVALVFSGHWGLVENRESLATLLDAAPGWTAFCLVGVCLLLVCVYFKIVVRFVMRD